jgi:hypothetical protein
VGGGRKDRRKAAREAVHHGAEIALPRDLYADR